jgi:hypothetical protein
LAFLGLVVKVQSVQFACPPIFPFATVKKLHPNSLPKRTMFDEIKIKENGTSRKNHF